VRTQLEWQSGWTVTIEDVQIYSPLWKKPNEHITGFEIDLTEDGRFVEARSLPFFQELEPALSEVEEREEGRRGASTYYVGLGEDPPPRTICGLFGGFGTSLAMEFGINQVSMARDLEGRPTHFSDVWLMTMRGIPPQDQDRGHRTGDLSFLRHRFRREALDRWNEEKCL